MKVSEVISIIEELAVPAYQESYDNAGLIVGSGNEELKGVLIALDVTEDVIEEAIQKGANLIVSHHPIVFTGLKKINGKNYVERCLIKAIKNDVCLFAAHTNIDAVFGGVNSKICDKLKLENCRILSPIKNELKKLVCFVPADALDKVQEAVFNAGAGEIGNYDSCSFQSTGTGTFRAGEGANPYVGELNTLHKEPEIRFETVFPKAIKASVIKALKTAHPYEEVAYDVYPLDLAYYMVGSGMIGSLKKALTEMTFLEMLKKEFGASCIKHSDIRNKPIKNVAVCGGSGASLIDAAKSAGADVFVTADVKYHQFFDADGEMIIADIGHYESEQFTKDIFYDLLMKKIPTFAIHLSEVNTNPINYL